MQSDTKFAQELNYHTPNAEEARAFLSAHEAQEHPLFMEEITHEFDAERQEFRIRASNQPFRFTQSAYLEFCGQIGIPEKFALKIPNDLLLQCVDEMLSSENSKVRLLVRDKDVICGVRRDSFVSTSPKDFLFAADQMLEDHLFREAAISDYGTSLLYEPNSGQMVAPNVENPADQFNVGIAFTLGFGPALVEARPYSLRHACINVAISKSEEPKSRLVEKLKAKGSAKYYGRLLENYKSDRYQAYLQEINARLTRAIAGHMSDWTYAHTFSPVSKLLGKEVAFALMGVSEEKHDEIMAEVKYKRAKDIFNPETATKIEDMGRYDVFNSLSAAAKGYSGLERVALQEISGALI